MDATCRCKTTQSVHVDIRLGDALVFVLLGTDRIHSSLDDVCGKCRLPYGQSTLDISHGYLADQHGRTHSDDFLHGLIDIFCDQARGGHNYLQADSLVV